MSTLIEANTIATGSKQLLDSLFTKSTKNGHIVKSTKNSIFFELVGHKGTLCVNKHGVVCSVQKSDNGKNWFSYAPFAVTDRLEKEFGRKLLNLIHPQQH